mmetsp:Transcript_98985/g.171541  ORF Transcript_98985/g.171541 Transcript_98985/m.171541 type:complete len:117 (+) Transcript_98985:1066-1416(+)
MPSAKLLTGAPRDDPRGVAREEDDEIGRTGSLGDPPEKASKDRDLDSLIHACTREDVLRGDGSRSVTDMRAVGDAADASCKSPLPGVARPRDGGVLGTEPGTFGNCGGRLFWPGSA